MSTVPDRLEAKKSVLVLVDIQERFRPLIHQMDKVIANTRRLVQFCGGMNIPIVVTEHYSLRLGVTVTELRSLFTEFEPVEKIHFSCCGCREFQTRLETLGRSQVILCGIESHVCIYQTALDLMRTDRQVAVVTDAVSSCSASNREIGLHAMAAAGVQLMGTQMAMFEILREAGTPEFKAVAGLLKDD